MIVKELTHSQQQPQAPSYQNSVLCPPKGPFLRDSWSWMKSSERHTLSNRGLSKIHLRLVDLKENSV